MGIVIDLQQAEDPRDIVHRAFQALAEGKLVVIPTETMYAVVCSALDPRATGQVARLFGEASDSPAHLALGLKSADEAWDYICRTEPLAARLARRCWPGPVTLRVACTDPDSAIDRLPPAVTPLLRTPEGSVAMRVPTHRIFHHLQQFTPGPLVLADAWRPGGEPSTYGAVAREQFLSEVSLLLDDGPCRYGGPATEVEVAARRCRIVRPGVVETAAIAQFAQPMILLVCTGNTCRSPMAQVLLEHRLQAWAAEQQARHRIGGPAGAARWLPPRVVSAGLAAGQGMSASPEAVAAVATRGLDLSKHQSRPVGDALIRHADLILTMTRSHRDSLVGRWPTAAARAHPLRVDGGDIADPIGCSAGVYQACAAQIDRELAHWVERLGDEMWAEFAEPFPPSGQG